MLAGTQPRPYAQMLEEIYQQTRIQQGVGFQQVFRANMQEQLKMLPVTAEDISSFLWFTQQGGLSDREMQLKLLEESHQQISNRIITEESKEQSRGQLAMSLGIMGGLLLIIVFI